jgi:ABC-2 type transport system permease protein
MTDLSNILWIEFRKAFRSRMPLWTALGSLFLPLGIAFLIFVSKNPDISRKLGLISAKADLLAYSAIDWPAYLELYGQLIAMGGFILFVLITSWIFGREFSDGTLKDMLAVPVRRSTIVLAKFVVLAAWSAAMALVIFIAGLLTGALIGIPGCSGLVLARGGTVVLVAAGMAILVTLPFALLASIGRGYLLPMGAAVLMMMMTNLAAILGWGEYFPWVVPGLYAQGTGTLVPASYWIVVLTGLAGMAATYLWWNHADQDRQGQLGCDWIQ